MTIHAWCAWNASLDSHYAAGIYHKLGHVLSEALHVGSAEVVQNSIVGHQVGQNGCQGFFHGSILLVLKQLVTCGAKQHADVSSR